MRVNTNFCKGNFLFNFLGMRDMVKERETRKCSFLFLFEAFSLAASILKYYSTSSTGVSYFFPIALGVLF